MIPVGLSHLHVGKFLNCGNHLSLCLEICPSHSNSWEQRMFFVRLTFKNAFTFQRASRIWQSKFYLCKLFFFPPLLSFKSDSTSMDGVERHQILLGHKCEPGADGVCLKIVPGKSCVGWESGACIQLTSLEDAHTKWKYYVAFKLLFLWYMRFYMTQKNWTIHFSR